MNLRQCDAFRAMMETGTVTAAAERLRVSQPAVSKILAQFERELGFRLFLRHGRRLVPTPDAHALYQEVRRAFVGLDYLTRFAGGLRELRQGHLVVVASHAMCSFYLPAVVARFLHRHPGLSVSLNTADSPAIAQEIAMRRADLGIAQFRVPTDGVHFERLCEVETVCILRRGHRLARRRVIRPADLDGETLVALAAVNRLRTRLAALFEAQHVVPRIQVDTPLASTACNLVVAGIGVSVLDRLSAEASQHPDLVIRPFRAGISEDLLMLSPEQAPLSGVASAFATLLRQTFGSEAKASSSPT
jgi:DNA-binding transcriptional LysR family regulator